MKSKQKLFIYDRKEMGVLVLLGITVAVFAFTLGVHLGKQVRLVPGATAANSKTIATQTEPAPSQKELEDKTESAQAAAEASLNQTLHDEITKSGLKLDKQRQVDLPTETKKKSGGDTELQGAKNSDPDASENNTARAHRFSLQIGSFPTATEAESQMSSFESEGLKPFVRQAEVKGMGKRFRVFVGKYESIDAAEKAGAQFRSQHLIKSFIVAKITG